MNEDNELVRPDPFYVRLEIANEHERFANHLGERADMFSGDVKTAIVQVMWAHRHRAEVMRRELGAEADRQSREAEDAREKPFTVAIWS